MMKQRRTRNNGSVRIVTREFRIEDYDALVALWKETGLPYKPKGRDRRDKIEREITGPHVTFLVAEVDGRLVGSVLATHDGRKGWINRLAVTPAFRLRGIAKKLVAEAENRLFSQGIEIVACLIEDWNVDSKLFFERIGYKRFDRISYLTKKKHPDV